MSRCVWWRTDTSGAVCNQRVLRRTHMPASVQPYLASKTQHPLPCGPGSELKPEHVDALERSAVERVASGGGPEVAAWLTPVLSTLNATRGRFHSRPFCEVLFFPPADDSSVDPHRRVVQHLERAKKSLDMYAVRVCGCRAVGVSGVTHTWPRVAVQLRSRPARRACVC